MQEVFVQAKQRHQNSAYCATHGQLHRLLCDCARSPWDSCRTGWRKESARRTSEHNWEWPICELHTWHKLHWHRNPIWAATPGSEEPHNFVIKLVLQCQSRAYQKRRWGNLANTACLPPALNSDPFATPPLNRKQQKKEFTLAKLRIQEAKLKQDWSCVAMAFLLRSGHRNSSLGIGKGHSG